MTVELNRYAPLSAALTLYKAQQREKNDVFTGYYVPCPGAFGDASLPHMLKVWRRKKKKRTMILARCRECGIQISFWGSVWNLETLALAISEREARYHLESMLESKKSWKTHVSLADPPSESPE